MIDFIHYIRILWNDIHHSRNQEWKFIAIITGVFASLFVESPFIELKIIIVFIGIIVCVFGLYTSIAHWIVFYSKMNVIHKCEELAGIKTKFSRAPFPIQGVVALLYVLLGSALTGWLGWLKTESLVVFYKVGLSIFFGGSILVCLFATWMRWRLDKGKVKGSIWLQGRILGDERPRVPFFAELDDLDECLKLMEQRPLKLIANAFYEDESSWKEGKWSFNVSDSKIIDKKLFVNPKDLFQFSVANEKSHQELHEHNEVVELFASHSKMKIDYGPKGKEKDIKVSKGVLIVPPGMRHKVQLNGLTFVFKCAIEGGMVHDDREVL